MGSIFRAGGGGLGSGSRGYRKRSKKCKGLEGGLGGRRSFLGRRRIGGFGDRGRYLVFIENLFIGIRLFRFGGFFYSSLCYYFRVWLIFRSIGFEVFFI